MIRADVLSTLYEQLPPVAPAGGAGVATAYLDTTHGVENAAKLIELRWREERRSLARQGADESTLDAIGELVGVHRRPPGPQGQVLVGAAGEVRYDAVLPQPPPRQTARFAALPHLMPLVAQLRPLVPHVLAVVDRAGGDVTVHGPDTAEEHELSGRDYPLHKSGQGGWSAPKYEHRTEETWAENARLVAAFVDSAVRRVGARLVVLSGDPKARSLVRDGLGKRSRELVTEIDEDVRHSAHDESLQQQVDRLVADVAAGEDAAAVARFEEECGQRDKAVTGLAATIEALRLAQVETLFWTLDGTEPAAEPATEPATGAAIGADAPSAVAWIGPEPVHLGLTPAELRALGVPDPVSDRLDAVLVRAAVGTGASIVALQPGRLRLTDDVGALLRYTLPG